MNLLKKIALITILLPTSLNRCFEPSKSRHLKAFFYKNHIGKTLKYLVTGNRFISFLTGLWADHWSSRYVIQYFISLYNIDLSQAEKMCASDYSSFNDFFIRKLQKSARPIDKELDSVVSPADGKLCIINNLEKKSRLTIKDNPIALTKLLESDKLAAQFDGGTAVIIYLAPDNYHRFHFPLNCIPHKPIQIKGGYESVHPSLWHFEPYPLISNERHVIHCQTSTEDPFIFIAIGALCVGRITETFEPYKEYVKGDEVGYFSFGGSTVVLLFKAATFKSAFPVTEQSEFVSIKMGQKIGSFIKIKKNV